MADFKKQLTLKSIAVCSGKGGVGKTTTAVNIAVYFALKNMRVALVDLDPLSDIAVLLDLKESEYILKEKNYDKTRSSLHEYVKKVFVNLDLLFPAAKLGKDDISDLKRKIYIEFIQEIVECYDLIIFDMPAGIREEDNLSFLQYVGSLIIVTNSEPAAHVSAGGYIRTVLKRRKNMPMYLWHNKFSRNPGADFKPEDVIGNYNLNSPRKARIKPKSISNIEHIAFIPPDPSLDLLQTNPSVSLNILRSILDMIEFLNEERLAVLANSCGISKKNFDLIKYFLFHRKGNDNIDLFIQDLGYYLRNIIRFRVKKHEYLKINKVNKIPEGIFLFSSEQVSALRKFYYKIYEDALRLRLLKIISLLSITILKQENERRIFFIGNTTKPDKKIDLEISRLLVTLNSQIPNITATIKNTGGMLLFYFSLYKLFQSKTVLGLVNGFIPVRKNNRGKVLRDKHRQIRNLVEQNTNYKKRFLQLIKALFPIAVKQLAATANTLGLAKLYYRNPDGKINKEAYAKLFSHFMHDTVNSGLGIIPCFRYKPASIEFHKACDRLYKKIFANEQQKKEKVAI